MFLNCIAVGAGGFLGAVSRYLMGMIPFLQKGSLPYHTLLINVRISPAWENRHTAHKSPSNRSECTAACGH